MPASAVGNCRLRARMPPTSRRSNRAATLAFALAIATSTTLIPSAMAIDLAPLWDFSKPELSEQRFRQALQAASGDDVLILETQIARSFGLRKDFDRAREVLKTVEPRIAAAGAEARVRYWLELGRTYGSATHTPEQLTDANKALARGAFQRAQDAAREGRLDGLAIDAIHMFAFIDTAPADQLRWAMEAMAVVEASRQPQAKQWEASIRNNIGHALHQLGRYDEALAEFRKALALREAQGNAGRTRVAWWMIAWTLRAMKRDDEALAIQLRLERECDTAGEPDPYVFEELEALYRAKGDTAKADHYAARRKAPGK
jgi:tetratricopeptide (TPR) repeat protein